MKMDALKAERGSTTTEFVMIMPVLAAAMLFLIGFGYTLMTKQNAVVGARAAVYYRATMEDPPPSDDVNQMIKSAISPGRESWRLEHHEQNIANPGLASAGSLSGAINGLYQRLNREIIYKSYGTATLGFLPRVLNVGEAQSTYYLPHRSWTCEQSGGSYGRIAMNGLNVPPRVAGWLETSCCDCYQSTR